MERVIAGIDTLSQNLSLYTFADNYTELAEQNPKEFIKVVEERFTLDGDWKKFLAALKKGSQADKSFAGKRSLIKPGEWIVEPYSRRRVKFVLGCILSGRLKEKGGH